MQTIFYRAEQLLTPLYRQAHRHYHTVQHVEALLKGLVTHLDLAADADGIRLAIWFHDAVYDSTKQDNEELSAQLAMRNLAEWGAPSHLIERVVAMIHATAKHEWTDGQPDTALFLDLDLGILAATTADYDRYASQIRMEYAWVPDDLYRAGRAKLLQNFLLRPYIYFTAGLAKQWEQPARANIQRELTRLRQG